MDSTIVIDVDGTLCRLKRPNEGYANVEPNMDVIATLKQYSHQGYKIALYTSRNMRSYSNNTGKIIANTLPVLIEWLNRHDVPYDEIHVGKPWPGPSGFYVDDRTVRPEEFVSMTEDQIQELLRNER